MKQSIMLGTISLDKVAGGLEKNIVYLANQLADEGHTVVLLSFDLHIAKSFYKIDERVVWIKAGVSQPHARITFAERICLIKNIRLAMTKHKVTKVVVFSHGLLARFLVAGLGLKTMFICSERNSLSMYDFIRQSKWNINFILLALVKRVTVQFDSYKNDYPFWLRPKITVVHNPVFPSNTPSDIKSKRILLVGRLTAQKRVDFSIRAFAMVYNKYPDWQMRIVGDGPLKDNLLKLISELGLTKAIQIVPPSNSVEDHYKSSSIFLITSQWEGFPNALAEALAHGLVAVGLNQTQGVPNLIVSGYNGELVEGQPTISELAKTLIYILECPEKWHSLSQNAQKITHQFSSRNWINRWLRLLA